MPRTSSTAPASSPKSVLTEQDWQRLLPLLSNIDPHRQQAAYNRLVLGMKLVEAGEPFGYSKQNVEVAVKAVLRWWDKLNRVPGKPKPPSGWVALELVVPRNRVDEVRRVVEALCPPRPGPEAKRARAGAKPRLAAAKPRQRKA